MLLKRLSCKVFWQKFLHKKRTRQASTWTNFEPEGALFLRSSKALIATTVAINVLKRIAQHHGTAIDLSTIYAIEQRLTSILPQALINQLDAEADEILNWCFEPTIEPVVDTHDPEQLAALRQNMPERLALFEHAITDNLWVTFEAFDAPSQSWFVWHVEPVGVQTQDEVVYFVVRTQNATQHQVDASHVRWLMPTQTSHVTEQALHKAKVLSFPFGSSDH